MTATTPAAASAVVAIRFRKIVYPQVHVTVPLAEAWQYYEDSQGSDYSLDGYGMATVTRPDGSTFETYMKIWTVWDFTKRRHVVTRFGLGAYGDGGPTNPAVAGLTVTQHLDNGHWVSGINRPPAAS